jgi:hypothetical protein
LTSAGTDGVLCRGSGGADDGSAPTVAVRCFSIGADGGNDGIGSLRAGGGAAEMAGASGGFALAPGLGAVAAEAADDCCGTVAAAGGGAGGSTCFNGGSPGTAGAGGSAIAICGGASGS